MNHFFSGEKRSKRNKKESQISHDNVMFSFRKLRPHSCFDIIWEGPFKCVCADYSTSRSIAVFLWQFCTYTIQYWSSAKNKAGLSLRRFPAILSANNVDKCLFIFPRGNRAFYDIQKRTWSLKGKAHSRRRPRAFLATQKRAFFGLFGFFLLPKSKF